MRSRYEKARKGEGEDVHAVEGAVLAKLKEIEARKQFELVDMCCDLVDDRIEYLQRVHSSRWQTTA